MMPRAEPMFTMLPRSRGRIRFQGRHRAPHLAEEGDLHGALEVGRLDSPDRGKHRGHGVIDPHVDRAELLLGLGSRRVYLVELADVGGQDQSPATGLGHLRGRRVEACLPPGDQAHVVAVLREGAGGGPADPRGCSGDQCHLAC